MRPPKPQTIGTVVATTGVAIASSSLPGAGAVGGFLTSAGTSIGGHVIGAATIASVAPVVVPVAAVAGLGFLIYKLATAKD